LIQEGAGVLKPFGKYGEYYDLIYQDKDYEGECDFIDIASFRRC